ncbi:Zn(2)-C6 fungal-type domain-containing protein [Fusarium keratoplasticum]|nr:Zn(2)-C6 fungal-type domain-containing protein [Fusarium keratoplasticum]
MQSTHGWPNEHLYTAPHLDGEDIEKESREGLLEMPKAQVPRFFAPIPGDFSFQQHLPDLHKRLDDSLSLEILEFSPPTPPINTSSAGEATSLPASSIIEEVYPVAQAEADLFHNSPIHSNDLSTQLSYDQTSAESDRRTSFGTAIDEEAPKVSGEIAAPLAITAGCWEEIGAAEIPSRYDFALESQGCYRIPSAPVLKTFMHHYFLYVHPMLPVLNEGDFWDLHFPEIQTTSKTRQPSILLLQAMLFAACPFVAEEDVKGLGFETIRQAKASFYKQAKLLYSAQDPSDHVLMAQAALLLTHRCPSLGDGEQRANSTWLSRAIQHAKALNADRCANSLDSASPQQGKRNNTLRRIWLSCIIRDRVLSLCLRRKVQINHTSYAMSHDEFSDEIQRSRVYDADSKQSLITIMLLMTELCLCLSNILTVAYSVRDLTGSESHGSSRKTMQIWECKKDLETWSLKAVASSPVLASTQPGRHQGGEPTSSILMFAHLVWIYYHSSRITLCNTDETRGVGRQNCLNILIKAIREYRPRHEEADWITRAIRYFMECTYLEPAASSRQTVNGQSPEADDVMTQNPTHYLKLALTLDLSLGQDRLPVEKDFPARIQALISRTGCFMPIVFSHGVQVGGSVGATPVEQPSSEMEQSAVGCASPQVPDFTGWIQNDRSLFFAQEMGLADTLVEPTIPGHELMNFPTFSFLITHDTTRKQLLFDLGCRKDFWNLPEPISKTIDERVPGIRVDDSLADILQQGGINLEQIEAAIISHHHYDHMGDPSTFPKTMDLIVGPGFRKHFLPGYPKNPNSPVHESAFQGRTVREVDFDGHSKVAGYEAIDYFGDGSLFLLNTPGHAVGHLSALVRTTRDTFVFLGGDICHFGGAFRPNEHTRMPAQLKREEVALPPSAPELVSCAQYLSCHPNPDRASSTPYYQPCSRADSWYVDPPEAHKSVNALMSLDTDDKVLVLIAHDPSIVVALPLFPNGNLNHWHQAGWKQLLRWRFLAELPVNGQPRPYLVDGTYVDGKRVKTLDGTRLETQ